MDCWLTVNSKNASCLDFRNQADRTQSIHSYGWSWTKIAAIYKVSSKKVKKAAINKKISYL